MKLRRGNQLQNLHNVLPYRQNVKDESISFLELQEEFIIGGSEVCSDEAPHPQKHDNKQTHDAQVYFIPQS